MSALARERQQADMWITGQEGEKYQPLWTGCRCELLVRAVAHIGRSVVSAGSAGIRAAFLGGNLAAAGGVFTYVRSVELRVLG